MRPEEANRPLRRVSLVWKPLLEAARRHVPAPCTKTVETGRIPRRRKARTKGPERKLAVENMFAVIKTGGKQYKVAANDILKIEKLEAAEGDVVTFDQVLMVGDDAGTTIGAPLVEGALVAAEFLGTKKQKTVIIFKKNRRHNYRRRNGHRQLLSSVRITEILLGGAQPTPKAANAETAAETAPAEAKPARASRKAAAQAAPADDIAIVAVEGASGEPDAAADDAASAKPLRKTTKKAAPAADQE